MNRIEQVYLALAALTALAVAFGMLVVPTAFYGSYGIDAAQSPSLANELRAPGAVIGAFGVFLSSAMMLPRRRGEALVVSAVFYLGYALARSISAMLDGMPSEGLVLAGILELALGLGAAGLLIARSWRTSRAI